MALAHQRSNNHVKLDSISSSYDSYDGYNSLTPLEVKIRKSLFKTEKNDDNPL
jgi:hypothetical protein